MKDQLDHLRLLADLVHETLRPAAAAVTPDQTRGILLSVSKALYNIHNCIDFLERRTRDL